MGLEFALALRRFTAERIDEVFELSTLVFGRADLDHITWRMTHMPDASAFLALSNGSMVGFKIGYATSESKYYSWLGAVHRDHRRRGIASALMNRQHAWIAERGYATVETATNQHNAAMLQVDLRHGFSVCGMRAETDRTQILLIKRLVRD